MSEAHIDAWRKNIEGKVQEIQQLCCSFCSGEVPPDTTPTEHRRAQRDRIHGSLDELTRLYAKNQTPTQIGILRSACDTFLTRRDNSKHFHALLVASSELAQIVAGLQTLISFHDVFEAYKNDDDLNELVDRLIATLETVQAEGDDHLNRRVTRELERILGQLKARDKFSLYELAAWVEIAGRFAAEVVGQKYGVPGLSLLVDAAKLSRQIGQKIVAAHQLASVETVRLIEIETLVGVSGGSMALTEEEVTQLEVNFQPLLITDVPS